MNNLRPIDRILCDVLDSAIDAGDAAVIAACRRLTVAARLGWQKYADPPDIRLVMAFA